MAIERARRPRRRPERRERPEGLPPVEPGLPVNEPGHPGVVWRPGLPVDITPRANRLPAVRRPPPELPDRARRTGAPITRRNIPRQIAAGEIDDMLRRGLRVLIHYVKRRGGARRILEPDANPPVYVSRTGRPFPYSPPAYGLNPPIYDKRARGWRVFAPTGVTRIEAFDPETGEAVEDYRRWIGSRVERPEKHAADAIDRTGSVRRDRFYPRGVSPIPPFAEDAGMSMTFAERFRRRYFAADSDSDLGLRATYVCIRLPDYIASNYPPKPEDASGAHITVQYFGEQSKPWARRLADALGERLKAWKSFAVSGAGRGVFEKAEDGKDAVYTPVHDAERRLHALRELVAHAAKDIGGEWESKHPEYIPHVTIKYVPHGEAMSVDAPSEWTATVDHVEVAWGDEKVSKVPFGTPQHVPMPRSFVEAVRQRVAFSVPMGSAEAGPGHVNHFTPGVRGFRRQKRRRDAQAFALKDIPGWDTSDTLAPIGEEERRITGLRGLTGAQRRAASRGERVSAVPSNVTGSQWIGPGDLDIVYPSNTVVVPEESHLVSGRSEGFEYPDNAVTAKHLRGEGPAGGTRSRWHTELLAGGVDPDNGGSDDWLESLLDRPLTPIEKRTLIEAQSGIGRISRLERQPLSAAMRRGLPGLPAKGTFSAEEQDFAAPRSRMLPGTSGAGQFVREHIPGQYRANVARALGVQELPAQSQQQFGIADRIASAGRKVTSLGKWWLSNVNPAPTYRAARNRGMGRIAAGATTAGAHIADLALTGGKAPIAVAATRKWLSRGQPAESQGFAVVPQVPDEMNPPEGYSSTLASLRARLGTEPGLADLQQERRIRAAAANKAQRSHYSPARRIQRILAMANSYIDSAPGEDPVPDPSLVETLPDTRRYGLVKQERARRGQGFAQNARQDFAKMQIPARVVEIPDTLLRRIVPAAAWGVTPTGGITRPFSEQQNFGAISRRIGTAAGSASRWLRSGIAGMKREMGPQARNRLSGAGYGMVMGGALGGPLGAAIGGGAGALLGMRGIGQAARPTLIGATRGAVGVGRALKTGVNAVADATNYVRQHGVGGTIKQGIGAIGRGIGRGLSAAGRGMATGLGQTGRVLGAAGAEVGRQAIGGIKSAAGDAWRDMRAGYQRGSSTPQPSQMRQRHRRPMLEGISGKTFATPRQSRPGDAEMMRRNSRGVIGGQSMSAGRGGIVGGASRNLDRTEWPTPGMQGFALDPNDDVKGILDNLDNLDNEPDIVLGTYSAPPRSRDLRRMARGRSFLHAAGVPVPSAGLYARMHRSSPDAASRLLLNRMGAAARDATRFELDAEQADPDAQYFARGMPGDPRRAGQTAHTVSVGQRGERRDWSTGDLRYRLMKLLPQLAPDARADAQSVLDRLGMSRKTGRPASIANVRDTGEPMTRADADRMLVDLRERRQLAGDPLMLPRGSRPMSSTRSRLQAIINAGIRGRALPEQEGRRIYGVPDLENVSSIKSMRAVSKGDTLDALRKSAPMRHGVEALADLAAQDDWRANRRAASIQRQWQKGRDRAAYLGRLTNRDAQIANPARVNQANRNAAANDERAAAMLGVQPADVPVEVVTGEPVAQGAPRWGRPKREPIPLTRQQAKTWIDEADKYIGPRSSVRFPDALELASRREGRRADLQGGEKYRRFSDVERECSASRNVGAQNRLAVVNILRGYGAVVAKAPRHAQDVLKFGNVRNRSARRLVEREGSQRQQQDVSVKNLVGNVAHRKRRQWVA